MVEESSADRADGDLRRKLIRGGIVFAVLVAVLVGIVAAVPGLPGVRSAVAGASSAWVLAAFGVQLLGVAAAIVFVQAVFDELPRRLSWWQGWGQQGANAVLPTAGSTGSATGAWTRSTAWRSARPRGPGLHR